MKLQVFLLSSKLHTAVAADCNGGADLEQNTTLATQQLRLRLSRARLLDFADLEVGVGRVLVLQVGEEAPLHIPQEVIIYIYIYIYIYINVR